MPFLYLWRENAAEKIKMLKLNQIVGNKLSTVLKLQNNGDG